MPLAIPGGGDSRPFIRFGASINAWQMSGPDSKPVEFDFSKPAVFDIQNIQLGWMLLETGNRDWQPWPDNQQQPKPQGEYKAGFDVDVYSTTMFGDEHVRSYSSNSTGNVMFIQELYNAAEQHAEFAQGLSPVVQLTGSKAIKVGKGTTRIPQFQILKWVPRPAALDASGADHAPAPAPAAKPAAKPAPAPAAPADDSEF
jgi:hypothetical protein